MTTKIVFLNGDEKILIRGEGTTSLAHVTDEFGKSAAVQDNGECAMVTYDPESAPLIGLGAPTIISFENTSRTGVSLHLRDVNSITHKTPETIG